MPSTYTLNNGIELIATGEQSGTWGSTTNVNLSLIDTALDGQVTVTLAAAGTSGAPNTLAISDGSASDGRNRLVIFDDGGDLGTAAFVQLTPNDAEKIVYIRNNLSGGRAITLFQGTYNASNDYVVPAGTTAVVFFDGGGAGAVAANVFNNAFFDSLRLGSVSVTAILDEDDMASDSDTALPTQQSVKAYVDAQVGANNELSEVLANGNTTGGTDIVVSSGDQITTNTINETTAASGVTIDGVLLKDGTITSDGLTVDGLNARVNLGGIVGVQAANNVWAATDNAYFDGSWKYKTTGSAVALTAFRGNQVFRVRSAASGTADTVVTWQEKLVVDNNGDISFYEDTGTTPKFFWDASAERLGIGTTSPARELSIGDGTGSPNIQLLANTGGSSRIEFADPDDSDAGEIQYVHSTNYMQFTTNGTERMRITSTGNVGIGTSAPGNRLEVIGTSATALNTQYPVAAFTATSGGAPSANSGQVLIGAYYDNTDSQLRRGYIQAQNPSGSVSRLLLNPNGGNVGIGTTSPTNLLDVNADSIRVRTAQTPATAGAAGNQGEIAWDADYIYVCVATNTWKRAALSTW